MSGPSLTFVAFGLLVALVASARRSSAWRRGVVLLASVAFLASFSHDPRAFLPLAGFLVLGYLAMRLASAESARARPVAIAGVLLVFFWLKRYAFIPSRLFLPSGYVTVGLSYILFRLLYLVIEVRDNPALAKLPVRAYLGYLISFNTLVAGPIQLYDEYAADTDSDEAHVTFDDIGFAAERIVVGLFKTNAFAALFAAARDSGMQSLRDGGTGMQTLVAGGAVFGLYPLFLYCNFAGYIDIVIGLSRLFGQRLPENFNRPFSATSFIDFWSRWHITLSTWFRTYVYNPLLLTLMRRFPSRSAEPLCATLAFFVTFFLVGVWHGQTVAFLFFGVLQGLGVSANKLYQIAMTKFLGRKPYAALAARAPYRMLARGLTFSWFAFTLIWFWASWSQARAIWGLVGVVRGVAVWIAIIAGSSVALGAWELLRAKSLAVEWGAVVRVQPLRMRTAWLTTLLVIVAVVVLLSTHAAPRLVYADF